MTIKNLQITSASALDLELDIEKPVCVIRGEHSELALDLIRELIGDYGEENDPDRFDDGHFLIHSDIEIEGKNYTVCYIRNADFMGDNRIAANFVPNSLDFSGDDTVEFIDKCNVRDKDTSNVFYNRPNELKKDDDRPIFVYNLDDNDESDIIKLFDTFAGCGRQVFVAVQPGCPIITHESVQYSDTNPL